MTAAHEKRAARVYLHEARNRRTDPVSTHFYWTLIRWAANARRRAAAASQPTLQASQLELFA